MLNMKKIYHALVVNTCRVGQKMTVQNSGYKKELSSKLKELRDLQADLNVLGKSGYWAIDSSVFVNHMKPLADEITGYASDNRVPYEMQQKTKDVVKLALGLEQAKYLGNVRRAVDRLEHGHGSIEDLIYREKEYGLVKEASGIQPNHEVEKELYNKLLEMAVSEEVQK